MWVVVLKATLPATFSAVADRTSLQLWYCVPLFFRSPHVITAAWGVRGCYCTWCFHWHTFGCAYPRLCNLRGFCALWQNCGFLYFVCVGPVLPCPCFSSSGFFNLFQYLKLGPSSAGVSKLLSRRARFVRIWHKVPEGQHTLMTIFKKKKKKRCI